ncbi:MAG: valine--tRNA ligase, partial [Candidatus Caenarcaniphilales bacterium]|nr:valine--tRNA ligase [Candidatus Caenarcaniphilales bacterium]
MQELQQYDHKTLEPKWTEQWLTDDIYKTQINPGRKTFSIALPPPNVTGELHMGHALGGTIQDVLIRYHRMRGYDVLWQIGTDHAGIGTQLVVEKFLKSSENKSKYDLGREEFLNRVKNWKETYGNLILEQMKVLGFSPDYSRCRYTMDEHYQKAVLESFIKYFNDDLIYRGNRITNWCPKCLTSLSDLEIEKQSLKKKLYKIDYKFTDGSGALTVSTTRPETMFGDVAVAINPNDTRYSSIVSQIKSGKNFQVLIPLSNKAIPVILDEQVKLDFGTGALKVTPAHDANDYDIAQRHHLAPVLMMDKNAKLLATAEIPLEFQQFDRYKARDLIIEQLNLISEEYDSEKDLHDRCATEIEPYLSNQWYVNMQKLAGIALETESSKRTAFVPERYTQIFKSWLENIRDWCISRQIWWGHQIPVYFYQVTSDRPLNGRKFFVDDNNIQWAYYAALSPENPDDKQDPDVLDTWFSSALWPFVTLQDDKKIFDHFYPTSVLATAREIINLWVTRMIFSSEYFEDKEPFKHVLIHPVVQTPDGKRMSKSKGNAINPLDLVEKYGADASRMWYTSVGIYGQQDVRFPGKKEGDNKYSSDTFEQYRKFANKLFNAFKFVHLKLCDDFKPLNISELKIDNDFDLWILYKHATALDKVSKAFEDYDLSTVQKVLYEFLWFDFCDWYIELSKVSDFVNVQKQILFYIMESSLRALAPIMPFITEELWQVFNDKYNLGSKYIALATYPVCESVFLNKTNSIDDVNKLIEVLTALRNTRQTLNISWSNPVDLNFSNDKLSKYFDVISKIIKAKHVKVNLNTVKPSQTIVFDDFQIVMPLAGLVDISKLQENINKKIDKIT